MSDEPPSAIDRMLLMQMLKGLSDGDLDQGDLRPMARSREAMRELNDILKAREPFYRQAHLHLNTSGKSADQSLQELLDLLPSG